MKVTTEVVVFEYGIMHHRDTSGDLHRGPYATPNEVLDWLDEWREEGSRPDAFYAVMRPIGEWRRVSREELL